MTLKSNATEGKWIISLSQVCVSLYEEICWLRKSQNINNYNSLLPCVCFPFTLKANRGLPGEVLSTGPRVSVLTGDELGSLPGFMMNKQDLPSAGLSPGGGAVFRAVSWPRLPKGEHTSW